MEKDLKVRSSTANRYPVCWGADGIEMNVSKDATASNWSASYQEDILGSVLGGK
jgi:hypothetical protein